MSLVTVSVTAKHIKKGVPQSTEKCMTVLAVRDLIRGDVALEYNTITGYWFHFLGHPLVKASDVVVRNVRAFDERRAVEPFTFQLNIPDALLRTLQEPSTP
jgi:hypothetical protein